MAIPIGTTGRNLAWVARWTLAGTFVLGIISWLGPGYFAWGGLAAGLLAVLALWLLWRTMTAERALPAHPIQLVLLGLLIILAGHLGWSGLGLAPAGPSGSMGGALDMSMIFHLLLLALAVMLSESLLPALAEQPIVVSLFAAALTVGPGAAVVLGGGAPHRSALALLAFAGLALWLAPWGQAGQRADRGGRWGLWGLRLAKLLPAGGAAALLALAAPTAAAVAGAVSVAVAVGVGLVLARRILAVPLAALLLAGGGAALWAALRGGWQILQPPPAGAFGLGEEAFRFLWAGDSGLAVLGAVAGYVGLCGVIAGSACSLLYLLARARVRTRRGRLRAMFWTTAAALAGCAVLAPGGAFVPAATITAALTWGLLPFVLRRRPGSVPGAVLVALLMGLMLLLGLVRRLGLASWAAQVFGGRDKFLHLSAGFLLAMSLAWLMGSRRWWVGLIGIALAALAGGAGEVLQIDLSRRSGQMSDWQAHAVGSAVVVVPYLLAMGARWCESPEARPAPKAERSGPAS